MKRGEQPGRNAFDLMEEATHRLRTAPAATLAAYYSGAIPFVLGLLYFWADMSRSPLAPQHLAGASFGLAVLYCWMKFCQTLFARRIRAQAAGESPPPPEFRRCARIFCTQAILQPSGLLVLPLALLPVLPFPWVYVFYQNITALDDGGETGAFTLMKRSWQQARLWPRQNHLGLGVAGAFTLGIFLNWATVCLTLPQLIKMLFGVESNFTQSPAALLNTTFFAAICGLTYLCVDPILKTMYALRCFYGDALQSGEDLKAELKPFIQAAIKAAAAMLILSALLRPTPAVAETTNLPAAAGVSLGLPPPELDRAINQTIHERKYAWRMPREQVVEPEAGQGILARFLTKAGGWIRDAVRSVCDRVVDWLQKLLRHTPHSTPPASGPGWIMSLQILVYGLAAAAIAALAVFLWRVWRNRWRGPAAIASVAMQPAPDLTDENTGADQLPEDGWTRLARELLERGEFRLAMRAFYLASLAQLAERNLIRLARCKSNREYERELRRRAHSFPEVIAVFGDNLSVFERIWYGTHEASGELVRQFAAGVEKLKTGA